MRSDPPDHFHLWPGIDGVRFREHLPITLQAKRGFLFDRHADVTLAAGLRVHEFLRPEILPGENQARDQDGNPLDVCAIHKRHASLIAGGVKTR